VACRDFGDGDDWVVEKDVREARCDERAVEHEMLVGVGDAEFGGGDVAEDGADDGGGGHRGSAVSSRIAPALRSVRRTADTGMSRTSPFECRAASPAVVPAA
jgi:hypothetical protein